jgi:hypothetical protein
MQYQGSFARTPRLVLVLASTVLAPDCSALSVDNNQQSTICPQPPSSNDPQLNLN